MRTSDDEDDDVACQLHLWRKNSSQTDTGRQASQQQVRERGQGRRVVGSPMKCSSTRRQESLGLSRRSFGAKVRDGTPTCSNTWRTPHQPDPTRPGVGADLNESTHVDKLIPNLPARQEQSSRKMRITPHMLETIGFTEECKGSSTSKQVSNAHEIILKHVESWRPYARTLLTLASD